jgi:hypothetical protein
VIGLAVNIIAARKQNDAPAPPPCRPAHPVYGAPPAGLSYVPAPDALRRRTLRALKVDARADLQLVKRGATTYGEVVGVPTKDPQGFVDHKVREAHGKATSGPGYSLIPFGDNDVVALGARGCRAVFVAAATPDDVRLLAGKVFS